VSVCAAAAGGTAGGPQPEGGCVHLGVCMCVCVCERVCAQPVLKEGAAALLVDPSLRVRQPACRTGTQSVHVCVCGWSIWSWPVSPRCPSIAPNRPPNNLPTAGPRDDGAAAGRALVLARAALLRRGAGECPMMMEFYSQGHLYRRVRPSNKQKCVRARLRVCVSTRNCCVAHTPHPRPHFTPSTPHTQVDMVLDVSAHDGPTVSHTMVRSSHPAPPSTLCTRVHTSHPSGRHAAGRHGPRRPDRVAHRAVDPRAVILSVARGGGLRV
jgi:hypothetical protein